LIRNVGLQLTTRFESGRTTERFIEWSRIKHVVINEAFYRMSVIYYLVFVVESDTANDAKQQLVLAFGVCP
jgi:hypothetical protein